MQRWLNLVPFRPDPFFLVRNNNFHLAGFTVTNNGYTGDVLNRYGSQNTPEPTPSGTEPGVLPRMLTARIRGSSPGHDEQG